MSNTAEVLRQACELMSAGNLSAASETLATTLVPAQASVRRKSWSAGRLVKVFSRDGFTDRYTGEPLVFPGTLRALSILTPSQFPFHPNWVQSLTHPAYWTHYPTIDHVVPVARGGPDDETNIVTTSMLRNSAKSNWLLSELGWSAEPAPIHTNWDGLLPWFCREFERNAALRLNQSLRRWYRAAKSV